MQQLPFKVYIPDTRKTSKQRKRKEKLKKQNMKIM